MTNYKLQKPLYSKENSLKNQRLFQNEMKIKIWKISGILLKTKWSGKIFFFVKFYKCCIFIELGY